MAPRGDTRLAHETYVRHLREDSARFAQVLAAAPADARVPTCPGWDAGDLAYHLLGVQSFWRRVVSDGITGEDAAAALATPGRPTGHDALLSAVGQGAEELAAVLEQADPAARRWTWSTDQTVGFTVRRQAHEACIHRLDAELTAAPGGGARTAVDAALAADGVDEALRVVFGRPWAQAAPVEGRIARLVATDTGDTWLVTATRPGQHAGGRAPDEPGLAVADHDPVDGTVHPVAILSGSAEDLYCRLWRRPVITEPARTGDLALLAEIDGVLAGSR